MNKKIVFGALAVGVVALSGVSLAQAAPNQKTFDQNQPHRPGMRGIHKMIQKAPGDRGEALASFLGLTHQELHEARVAGKTLEQVALEQGKSTEDLKAFFDARHEDMQAKVKERLSQAVEAGRITQEQMDARLEHMERMHEQREELGPPGMHQRGFQKIR